MQRHVGDPGAVLASTITAAAALGFVPVAAHFNLFSLLVQIGPVADAATLTKASDESRSNVEKQEAPLCVRLTLLILAEDTMFAMAGLGFVDLVNSEYDTYRANAITNHIHAVPSAIHGMLHFTTEPLFAATFLIRKLSATKFEYPFRENETPYQYGWELLGRHDYAKENLYSVMYKEGRMPSFNVFMEGKFGKFGTMPERVKSFGYDLDAVLAVAEDEVAMVDVGGGRGEMLLEVGQAFPYLRKQHLVLQEYHPDAQATEKFTVMDWDYKGNTPQPVRHAKVFSLTHIYHNLPDLEALRLMQKIAKSMDIHSRMLIHEFSKNANYGKMHATLILQFGGRIRSSHDWHQIASLCGLQVTFEAYPQIGEGLIEMKKVE